MKQPPPDDGRDPVGPASRDELEKLLEGGWLQAVADSAPMAVMAVDTEGRMRFWNRAAEEIFGWRAEEVLGHPNPIVPGPKRQEFQSSLQDTLSGRPVRGAKLERRRKDGSSVWIRLSNAPLLDADGRAWGAIAVAEDISEGVKARRRLDRVGRALRARAALAAAVIGAESEEELFEAACRAAVEEAGYRLAWVGLAHDDPERRVIPVATAGFEDGYLEGIRITWDESPTGRGPTGTAIRTGRPAVAADIEHDPRFSVWREDALRRGYRSSVALPLVTKTGVMGALNLYAPEPDAFDDEELELLGVLAQDLSLAVTAKRALLESEERYRLAFHTSPDAVNINRLEDGVYVDINEGFTRITGYTREDVLGKSSLELHIWANPEDRDRLVAQLRSQGVVRNMEAPFRMKDGSLRTGLMSAVVIVLGDEPHILSITRDITELVHTREQLELSTARLEILHAIDRAILQSTSIDELYERVLEKLAKLVPAKHASLAIFDEDAARAVVRVRGALEKELGPSRRLDLSDWFVEVERLRAAELVLMDDLAHEAGAGPGAGRLLEAGIRSLVAIPLNAHGALLGSLNFGFSRPGGSSDGLLEIGREVADSIAVAMEQARLREAEKLHARDLEARVAQRTAELRRAVDLMAGRELRMAELKKVIKALRRQLEEAGIEPMADDPLLGE